MGPHDEFLKLLLACAEDVRAFIGSLVLESHARDDVFQEVALVLWRQFAQYDRSRPFGAWARGIATHKILQRREQDSRFPVVFSPATILALEAAYNRTEEISSLRTDALRKCVEQVPAPSRRLLALRYERGLRANEIARQEGRSLDAVYQALSRLRARLEQCVRQRLALQTEGP